MALEHFIGEIWPAEKAFATHTTGIAVERLTVMPILRANGIELCYQRDGADGDPVVLLVHGIGCQLVQWPDSLVAGLIAAGFNVLRMDNRDAGLSEQMDRLGIVDVIALATALGRGELPKAPYSLRTMADDSAALLQALKIASAHVIGVSMGGMIAQLLAIHHPERVLSVTSIMSSSGAPGLPPPDASALASIMAPPVSTARADVIDQLRRSWDLIGGPHFKSTEVGMGRKAEQAHDRGRHPAGFLRQMAAIASDSGRAQRLAEIRVPALIIHGDADRLMPLACGEDTARRIRGARLETMPKMGHDLPEPLIPGMLNAITEQLRKGSVVVVRE